MMEVKRKNLELDMMIARLKPILPHRDKIGYVAARNTRILNAALTEFTQFKEELIQKYGEVDKDSDGNALSTISITPDSPNFKAFTDEFGAIAGIETEVELMTLPYEEVIGLLNGEEILALEWMFTE
jgi:hypothetical protein